MIKKNNMDNNYIVHKIASSTGTDNSIEFNLVLEKQTGHTYFEVVKTLCEKFEQNAFEDAESLFNKLKNTNKVITLETILK